MTTAGNSPNAGAAHGPKRPANLVYWVDERPPWHVTATLALQHVLLMAVGLFFPVVIAQAAGMSADAAASFVSLSMLASGGGTFLQTLRHRFIGSGFLCPEGPDPSFAPVSIQAVQAGGPPLLYGMTILSGLFEGLLSPVLYRLRAFFPAEVTGVVVAMAGFTVAPLAIQNMLGVGHAGPLADLPSLGLSLGTLAVIIGINVWGKGALRQYALLIGMVVGYVACLLLGRIPAEHLAHVAQASFFHAPSFAGLGWKFDLAFVLPFCIATIGSTLKNVGDVTTCQRINDAAWTRPDPVSVRGGIVADAAATVLAGAIGGMGQASRSANVGLSLATGATSRVIAYAAGAMIAVMAFFPKLAAIFAIMPRPVMGAGMIFACSFIVVSGMQIITARMLDARKILVVGISMVFGVCAPILQESLQNTPAWIQPLFGSSLTVATLTVLVLNALLRLGVGRRASLELAPDADASEKATDFLLARGAAWAARREIVTRAGMALGELTENIVTSKLAEGPIALEADFDEFNLDIFVRYKGRFLSFSGERPEPMDLLDNQDALTKLSSFLVSRYADRVDEKNDGGRCRVHLHFDH